MLRLAGSAAMPLSPNPSVRPRCAAVLGLGLLLSFGLSLVPTWAVAQDGAAVRPTTLRERLKARFQKDEMPVALPGAITQPGDHSFTLNHQGLVRKYRVHVPASYASTAKKASPLVMAFHGGGGNMDIQADDTYYGLITQSERSGYVIVFPNGHSRLRSGKLATWNAGICCGKARDENIDDVGFVRAVLADVQQRLNIDKARIFATGMSNGGMLSYRLACDMADTFKAIAAVAGTDGTLNCTPSRPVSVLHIHARDDDRVLFNGGSGSASDTHADFVSVPDTVAKWVKLNACSAQAKRVLEVPGAFCEVYSGCAGGTGVQLCVTETGGHSWPGGVKPRGGQAGSTAISANEVIWAFFDGRE
jgi:polyhydroxybutyrate depolymerase